MKTSLKYLGAASVLLLSGCGFFADEQVKLEQAWLAQHQQAADVLADIRQQGVEVVANSAEKGSYAHCVASQLVADPVAQLITVEGALVEGASIDKVLSGLAAFTEQEFSLANLASMLEQGAEAARYAKELIDQQGVEQAFNQMIELAKRAEQYVGQDLGAHFQDVFTQCEAKAN